MILKFEELHNKLILCKRYQLKKLLISNSKEFNNLTQKRNCKKKKINLTSF